MKTRFFIFGASSEIAQNFLLKLNRKYEIVCVSSKKIKNKESRIKNCYTNYKPSSIEKILKQNFKKKDKNVFLFFNGISEHKAFYKIGSAEIKKIINVNLLTPILITNIIIRNFFSNNMNFIYFSSSRALEVDRGISMYASTKKAIQSFAKSMALEYGNIGLNFKVISLGLLEGGLERMISETTRKSIFRRSSIKKNITIEQLYNVIQFAIKDKTGNGSTIKCDNGYF